MSKIVILNSSPRPDGNTHAMASAFRKEAEALGHEVTSIDVVDKKVAGCHACGACGSFKKCICGDDFQAINAKVMEADGIIIAAPVYWYTFPAQIKAVIDRWFSLAMSGQNFAGKKVALFSACADPTEETFTGISFAFRKSMELMKADSIDEVFACGCNDPGDVNKTDAIEKVKALAAKF